MSTNKFVVGNNKDEDDLDLSSPCFHINPDVQLKNVPTNGEEYLLTVIHERKNLITVTKCDRDYSKFAINQSRFVEELPRANAPEHLKPTIEWQNIQVADFSDVRMYISRLHAKKSSWPKNIEKVAFTQFSMAGWKGFFKNNEPTLSCLFGIEHGIIDFAIEALTRIVARTPPGHTIDHKIGRWIYALLACTRQPLLSETTSLLRNLARECAQVRSRLNPEDENALTAAVPLNIFICLVGRYFRQYDLAD